jgi:hypothetical protein
VASVPVLTQTFVIHQSGNVGGNPLIPAKPDENNLKKALTMKFVIAAALVLMIGTTTAQAAFYRCDVAEKWSCSPGRACMENKVTITNFIDTDQKLYYRCDQKGCDKYAAEMEAGGMFLNITPVPGNGMIAKMSLLPKMTLFRETATIMMDALISYGTCQETQRPN